MRDTHTSLPVRIAACGLIACLTCLAAGNAYARKKPVPKKVPPQAAPAHPKASSRELSPDEIVKKVDEVRAPALDYTITVDVESISSRGSTKSARYEVMVKGKDKTLIKTIKPQVERGRILLMNERNLWAFFPDVSKPIRLSMQERLIGDVSNGDIARINFSGDYNAALLRIETIGDKEYYCLELVANAPEVTYGRVLLWAQKATFWPLKAELYGISGRKLKTCSYEQYKMLAGALRPTVLVLEDAFVKGKASKVTYGDMRVGQLPEKYFTKDHMKKMMD